nr:MAG TPA: hypothetical protein [Caudoviricetes sp.]
MATTYIGTIKSKSGLSIRSGPGTEHPIIDDQIVKAGDEIYVYDITINGSNRWGMIGEDAWIPLSNNGKELVSLRIAETKIKSRVAASITTTDNTDQDAYNKYKYRSLATRSASTVMTYENINTTYTPKIANATTRLFGLPYQFNHAADPRYSKVSTSLGREYAEKFIADGCIAYIIPGKASFLPGIKRKSNKKSTAAALLKLGSDDLATLKKQAGKKADGLRFYDFQEDYTSYMNYVNAMCRAVAGFLELRDKIEITDDDGKVRSINPQQMDWKDYRWTSGKYVSGTSNVLRKVSKNVKESVNRLFRIENENEDANGRAKMRVSMDDTTASSTDLMGIGSSQNYIPFYIDPSIDGSESASNSITSTTVESKMKEIHSKMNEYGFLLNSASAGSIFENIGDVADSTVGGLLDGLSGAGSAGNILSKLMSTSKQVLCGENIIIPQIYDESQYSKQYNLTVHLRTPYGDKLSVFMDILVPMLHLLALALPKQSTANTYGSPFLIKMYVPGTTTCNLGIVDSIQITKNPDGDAWSVDGLPTACDVSLNIVDLYSNLTMSPTTEPLLFINNSSLIEYLATISGLNLITPTLDKKVRMIATTLSNSVKDIPGNAMSLVTDTIEHQFRDFLTL